MNIATVTKSPAANVKRKNEILGRRNKCTYTQKIRQSTLGLQNNLKWLKAA
jgi:hypothetical protein